MLPYIARLFGLQLPAGLPINPVDNVAINPANHPLFVQSGGPGIPPIEIRTRVYWGEHDPVLKAEWMDRLPETFSNLHASVAEEVGHFVHYEAPQRAARAIAEFFEPGRAPVLWLRGVLITARPGATLGH